MEGGIDTGWADGATLLGPVVDPAALQGLLHREGDLGLTLISVTTLE